jgi:shikimate kinase/SAM-dependent methyltransferase
VTGTSPALPKPIVVVGLMGVGKTTVGRALAGAIGYRFIDNDTGIQAEYDATGAELAAEFGVPELHRLEAAQLNNTLDLFGSEPVVIAAAGSVVDNEAIRHRLRDVAVVWLQAPPAYIAERQASSAHRRKLGLDGPGGLAAQAEARAGRYGAVADITVSVHGRAVADIVEEIHTSLLALPLMYTELAGWFHLVTDPADYEEEAAFYWQTMAASVERPIETILELGSGGGNNASHLKQHAGLTLVDLSPAMIKLSRTINPECEHVVGDMRTIRLDRQFNAVFMHDAVGYLTTVEDLRRTINTAVHHVRPGGVVLRAREHLADTFRPDTSVGGHGDGIRSLHYEERTWDPDPHDTTYIVDYTYRLSEPGVPDRVVEDRHELGLFPRRVWLELLVEAGLDAAAVPFDHSEVDYTLEVFIGIAPEGR